MHTKSTFVILAAIASAYGLGCSSSGKSSETTGTLRANLHRAKSCGELLDDLKSDAIYKLNKGIDRQIRSIEFCRSQYGDAQCSSGAYFGGGFPGERAESDAGAEAPTSGNASGGSGGSDDSASSYSETNTQVKGVDEADIVKNDGKYLYILHGRSFKVVNAWPADALEELSSIDIEGLPSEMFVADGKVVIYSRVSGTPIFAAAGVSPKRKYGDYWGSGGSVGISEPATGGRDIGIYTPLSDPLTKVTVLTLDGTTPSVAREVYFEGDYLDSRRVGSLVRTVLQSYQYGPELKHSIYELYATDDGTPSSNVSYPQTASESIAALQQLRSENIAIIQASQLPDWLPYTFVKDGDAVRAKTVACEDFYVPTAGSTDSGMTEIASLDLGDPTAEPQETAILGRADTVYGNADTLYVAAHAWVEPPFIWYGNEASTVGVGVGGGTSDSDAGSAGSEPTPAPVPDAKPAAKSNVGLRNSSALSESNVVAWTTNQTHVHKFEFASDPKFPNYVASGTVAGNVKNQFSLDEKDGNLRIATTEYRSYATTDGRYVSSDFTVSSSDTAPSTRPARPASVNRLFVLAQDGPWLEPIGDVGELAPTEQIYSVRFVGDRGYVVTFRQVDPLFVVDLSTPSSPTLLAELKIPGFSEYMHPIDDHHLLTIGRDATMDGRVQGLQLRIFDVTDGTNPIAKYEFQYSGSEYGYSEAQYDHKAFTYFGEKKLLAFPYYSYSSTDGSMRSSLELFKVDVNAGFDKLGSIDHSALVDDNPQGYCGGYYQPTVRRGIFLENFVYSISYGGVVVKDSTDLSAPGTELPLSAPTLSDGYGPVCY